MLEPDYFKKQIVPMWNLNVALIVLSRSLFSK